MGLPAHWFKLRYHPEQRRLWRSKARFVAAACGRGSGKTLLARRRLVMHLPLLKPHPDPMYFMGYPTRGQAKRISWEKLKSLVPAAWVRRNGISESDLCIRTVFGSSLWLVGMDEPARVEGDQWDGCVIDESCDQKPGHYDRSVRPALSHRTGWCWRLGVPKRWGPGAADFRKAWLDWHGEANLGADYEAFTWPSHGVLSDAELRDAMRSTDQKDFDEQYGAVWQGTSGLVFYAFDEVANLKEWRYREDLPIAVGSDFNVDPMAWVLMQQEPGTRDLMFFDEVWLRNTNTAAALDDLFKRYGSHRAGWNFFGDATGRARKTSASSTDYAQIVNDARFEKARVWYPSSNPPRFERFAACNAQFQNALGERHAFVDPRCVNLRHDLVTRAHKPFSRETDDYDDVGHITDAMGYVVHRLRPIVPDHVKGTRDILVHA